MLRDSQRDAVQGSTRSFQFNRWPPRCQRVGRQERCDESGSFSGLRAAAWLESWAIASPDASRSHLPISPTLAPKACAMNLNLNDLGRLLLFLVSCTMLGLIEFAGCATASAADDLAGSRPNIILIMT